MLVAHEIKLLILTSNAVLASDLRRKGFDLMKRKIFVLATIIIASAGISVAADAAANWNQLCASCHGKNGSGNTAMGKKLALKDYSKNQGFSDAEATNVIKNGKGKMKGYKDKLSDADVKALVAYVRSLKK
jgi:cytochrome c6